MFGPGDALLGKLDGAFRPRLVRLGRAPGRLVHREPFGESVALLTELARPGLPGGQGGGGLVGGRAAPPSLHGTVAGHGLGTGQRFSQPFDLNLRACQLSVVPGRLAGHRLGIAGAGSFDVLGPPAVRRRLDLAGSGCPGTGTAGRGDLGRRVGRRAPSGQLAIDRRQLRRQALMLGAPLERRLRHAQVDRAVVDDGRAVARNGDPASGQLALDGKA